MVEDVGDNGEADRDGSPSGTKNLRGFVNRAGLSKCPRFQSKAVCWHIRPCCACVCFECFFEFGKLVGCGAKVASSPQEKHQ